MQKVLIVANWKMNPATFREAKRLFEATKKAVEKVTNALVIIAPPAIYLRDLAVKYKGNKISFAAQNSKAETTGAFTGEISIAQVRDSGASYILVGHSEVRAMGETNDETRAKVVVALSNQITPILCVGETRRTKNGEHFGVVKEQIHAGLKDVPPTKIPRVIIAYEPVWAIGGEITMSPRDMHEMAIFIHKTVVEMHGGVGHSIKILYGASVGEKNALAMLREAPVRGFVVGHVSVEPERFTALIKSIGSGL